MVCSSLLSLYSLAIQMVNQPSFRASPNMDVFYLIIPRIQDLFRFLTVYNELMVFKRVKLPTSLVDQQL